jgi:hypothetical protein
MLIGPVLVLLLVLLFYKRPVNYVPTWTPPPVPQPMLRPLVPPAFPHAQQSAQGSAPIARADSFAAPPAASGFAQPPAPGSVAVEQPPPVDLNDVFNRPRA